MDDQGESPVPVTLRNIANGEGTMVKGKIALLLGQADEEYQQKFVKGVMRQAFADGFEVYVFSMYIKYQNNKEREIGDSNIYNLIPWDSFDAAILLSDTIQTPEVEKKLQERIHEVFQGPVVCVDSESDYFTNFWTDGYQAIYQLVSHLIDVHGVKDIAFLAGRKYHKHSIRRALAYREALQDHGIEVNEERILYGDFWYTSGSWAAETLLRDKKNLPQAIVCANDQMAIGVAETFEKNGIRIPEDVLLTGYGATEEGLFSPKSLTSAEVPAEYYGVYSVRTVLQLLVGAEVSSPEYHPELFLGESCGCHDEVDILRGQKRETWTSKTSDEGYYSIHNTLLDDMLRCDNLDGFLGHVYENLYQIHDLERFDLFLNDLWLKTEDMITKEFPKEGYSEIMLHAIHYEAADATHGWADTKNISPSERLLPDVDHSEPRGYIFTPVFVEDVCFGYAMISFGTTPRSYDEVYRLWIRSLARGLEELRRKQIMQVLEIRVAALERQKFQSTHVSSVEEAQPVGLTEEELQDRKEVERILNENLFTYHFQPIVRVRDGEIYSYEALMRSASERKINPLEIIRHATALDRLEDIEKYTFLNVLRILQKNQDIFEHRRLFINSIPGCGLSKEDREQVWSMIKENPGTVVVELTEQAEISEADITQLKRDLRQLGAGIAVDDYGTGYSNISNLLRYMPDVVKIDRSLLSDIHNSTQKQHFVRDAIEFCHSNNILALAEGVETSEELHEVIRLGADLIQGYYTGRPSPELRTSIDGNIKDEIARYYREVVEGTGEKEFIAGRVNRISVSNLVRDHKTTIVIGDKDATFRDITIVGMPGLSHALNLEILEGYDGRITLENVVLTSMKKRPCIRLADNVKLTLRLIGPNRLMDGGILVPESSTLNVEGAGSLTVKIDGTGGYGIGNLPDSKHGDISFYQDGDVRLDLNGKHVVGIGSGLGGKISINRGKYDIYLNGDETVGIGAVDGDSSLEIHDCEATVDLAVDSGVCIGSVHKNADVKIWSSLAKCNIAGKKVTAVGTIDGESATVDVHDMGMILNVNGDLTVGVGSLSGRSKIDVTNGSFRYTGSGLEAYCYGGQTDNTEMTVTNSDVSVDISTENGAVTRAPKEKQVFHYGRNRVLLNGYPVDEQ